MKQTKKQIIQQLYDRLWAVSEIPITESPDIHSKGLYLSERGQQGIYIKQSLSLRGKLKVLLHEYSHYVHLTHYYNEESRAECEVIANGSASFICKEYGLNIYKQVDLSKFSDDTETATRLSVKTQIVARHILATVRAQDASY